MHTHSPTFLPVLSTSPIDYYDGGTVRMNTEFYSWDTSFGPVNPRLRYSCLQVVFCVNLGTFFKCFLQLGWRLTGVRSTHTECSLHVPCMSPVCPLHVPCMFPCIVRDTWQHAANTEVYSWDTPIGHVNPRLRYPCGQVVFCVNLGTFFKRFSQLGWRPTGVRLIST
jgi:hypothetical protein